MHSYMEAIPFTCLTLMLCVHWDQLRESGRGRPPARMQWKRRPISRLYLATNLAAFLGTVILPYAEELRRCRRAGRRAHRDGPEPATTETDPAPHWS